MTRPNILRADTLDLQDSESPTAAEHTKHPQPTANGNAPHVAAQLHHVSEERQSEEQALSDAWNIAGSVTDDTSAIDQAQANHAQTHVTNGGASNGEQGGGEGAETDGESEDDMMDRMSSSPSIDDGQYTLPLSQYATMLRGRRWPARCSSLSPQSTPTPTRESFNQTADLTPDSSPFLRTPRHMPSRSRDAVMESAPFVSQNGGHSSPFDDVPRPSPQTARRRSGLSLFQSRHHREGRYGLDLEPGDTNGACEYSGAVSRPGQDSQASFSESHDADRPTSEDTRRPIESPFRRHSFIRSVLNLGHLEPSPSLSSIKSVDMDTLLLPTDDPLLDTPPSPTGSAGSWESASSFPSDRSEANASLQNRAHEDSDDDVEDVFIDLDQRFIDSGWGGECLRETEDIDFEFVYALHTFVATVEGQANATKGDTMVLLDDSNSYWWLVRVVKDSSIGYLPAEHIETPTERLARLNKHRNIDLSATMLSDNSEKSRNPLTKAMRRRKAKTVQFAAPTYVEASDNDYSSDDDEAQMIDPYGTALQTEKAEEPETDAEEAKAEAKDAQAEGRSSTSSQRASFDREQAATAAQALAAAGINGDDAGPKLVDKTEAAPLKSKRARNTDSFLKDDTIETRKITLTPGILREESRSPSDPPRSSSLESLTKTSSPTEQPKKEEKEKKKKEPKKGGMLSGLFKSKKKDKKSKEDIAENGEEKSSLDVSRDPSRISPMTSGKASPVDRAAMTQPPTIAQAAAGTATEKREPAPEPNQEYFAELPGSEVAHEMDNHGVSSDLQRIDTDAAQQEKVKSSNPLSPITNMLKAGDGHEKPKKAKRSKQRVELDDFDSPQEEAQDPMQEREGESESRERLSESPVRISSNAFMHGTDIVHIPTLGDAADEGEDTEDDDEEPESLSSSPSIIEHPAEPVEKAAEPVEDNDPTPTAPRSPMPAADEARKTTGTPSRGLSTDSTNSSSQQPSSLTASPITPQAWNDDSLRAWYEDGSEVRDMLVMIHDKTGVRPAPPTHPLMEGLFVEQRKGVQDMMSQLDGLLGSYLQRKGVKF